MMSICTVDRWGNKQWTLHGEMHREGDLPAREDVSGTKQWWLHGKLHRDGGLPAIEWAFGNKEWWWHGERHREGDLPAVEMVIAADSWYHRGERHRTNGPAILFPDGDRAWYLVGVNLSRGVHARLVAFPIRWRRTHPYRRLLRSMRMSHAFRFQLAGVPQGYVSPSFPGGRAYRAIVDELTD